MCVAAASLTAVAAIAGASMSAYGLYQQGQQQKALDSYNADLAHVQETDALRQGAVAEERQRQKVRQIMGSQTAAMGASGGVVGSGSFGNILDQTATFGEQDAQQIRTNALRSAWGFGSQATADNYMGNVAASNGIYGAAGNLLNDAPSIYKAGGPTKLGGAGWWG